MSGRDSTVLEERRSWDKQSPKHQSQLPPSWRGDGSRAQHKVMAISPAFLDSSLIHNGTLKC